MVLVLINKFKLIQYSDFLKNLNDTWLKSFAQTKHDLRLNISKFEHCKNPFKNNEAFEMYVLDFSCFIILVTLEAIANKYRDPHVDPVPAWITKENSLGLNLRINLLFCLYWYPKAEAVVSLCP